MGKYHHLLLSFLTIIAAVSPLRGHSETVVPDTITTGTEQKVGEVTVTARKSPVRVSAAMPVQAISGESMSELGIQNMADAVRRFAGTNVRDYGGIGGLKTVSVRNMGAEHTGVSYDGAPVSNCQGGQIDIGRFSLDNVSMLSLAIGQSEDMLQPAKLYASAAVLNIITATPEFEGDRCSAFEVQMKGGSFGYVNPMVRWWQKIGDRVRTSLDGNFMRADGNYPFTLVNGKHVTRERRSNSAIDSWHGEANIYYDMADGGELQVKGYYFYSKRGLPGAVTLYNPISTETLWDKNGFVQAKYRKEFTPQWRFLAIGKYNYGWNRDRAYGNQFEGGMYQDFHTQNEYYLSASAEYKPADGLSIALAQDGIINKLKSTIGGCPFPTRYTSLTALSARWRHGILTANGTLSGTYVTEHVKSGDKPEDLKRLIPSLALSVQPWSSEMLFFRAMYKSTFRTPSFNDLYYDRIGNRTLRPERANEYDLGVTWSRSFFPAMDYFSVTFDGYFNNVNDKIVAFPTTYAWKMANFGKVHITGIDITLATAFSLPYNVNLALSAAYTWQRALDLTDKSSKNYKAQLPYTPEHSGNAGVTVKTPWLTLGYSLVGVGKRYYLAQNIPVNEIAGYVEQTLTLGHEFKFEKCRLGLRGEIINLADKQYDVIKYYPMPGRSWRLVANVKF